MRLGERAITILNLAVVGVTIVVLLQPEGILRRRLGTWVDARKTRSLIESNWQQLSTSGPRLDGSGIRVHLIEFSDYECPFCKQVAPAIEALIASDSSIGIVYRHLPLPGHRYANAAARAAVCAEDQGRFVEFNRHLFESESWKSDTTDWAREALKAGIAEPERFNACLASPKTSQRIAEDSKLAEELGIDGTPAFVTVKGVAYGALSRAALNALAHDDN